MALPVHDTMASTVNLAKMLRDGLDMSQDTTSMRTATLALLLDTLIRFNEPKQHMQLDASAKKSLAQMIAPAILDTRGGSGAS